MSQFWERIARQWKDVANLVLGIWLLLSPWILAYAAETTAAWNAYVLGVIIGVAAVAALVAFHEWEEWVNAVFGAWLIVSPWVLGFGALTAAVWNQIVVGVLVGALAIWSVFTGREQQRLATKT